MTVATTTTPRQRLGVALAIGTGQTIAWGCTYYLPAMLAGPVAEELDQPRAMVVAAFSVALLVSGLCAPLVGRAIDRQGGRGVLAASALVIAAGLALLGLLPGIAGWFAGWLVLGLGMSLGLYDAAFATLGRLYGQAARPAITAVTLLAGFASTIAWPVTAALLPALGWRGVALCYAAVHVLVVLPLYWLAVPALLPDPPAAKDAPPRAPAPAGTQRIFLLMAGFFTIRSVISAVFSVHLIALLEGAGLALSVAVATAALVGAFQVAGRVLEFALGPRAHPLTVARIGAVGLPLGVVVLLLGGPGAVGVTGIAFAVLYGMSNGVLTISRGALPLAMFGPKGYATLMGRLAMPILLAQAAAPTLAAPLVEALPAVWVMGLCGLAAVVALACLVPLRAPARPPSA
jgi:MFS family permease